MGLIALGLGCTSRHIHPKSGVCSSCSIHRCISMSCVITWLVVGLSQRKPLPIWDLLVLSQSPLSLGSSIRPCEHLQAQRDHDDYECDERDQVGLEHGTVEEGFTIHERASDAI